ncbi:MAG: TolC family protein [Candidatus Aminicenantes bacterium]|nr:TolC family protein [Candidatus Aminicenantes bacterium]
MNKTVICLLVLAVTLSASPVFSQSKPAENSVLSALIKEALENNPRLEAAVQRMLATEKVIPQAGALPDPQLTLGLMNLPVNSFAFDQEPMTGKLISLMQMFPFPGKQALATDMAEYEASAVMFQQEEVRNQIIQMVKWTYYDLYALDRARETVEKNKALMEQFVQVTEIKYATGSGLQQDVLRAQVELSKLEDDLTMWQQKRAAGTARLNALLNRDQGSPFELTPKDLALPEDPLPLVSLSGVEERRPLLKAWKEKMDRAEAAVELARRDYWPNFTVGASYSQRDNLASGMKMYDFFSFTVSLNIPLYYKRKQGAKVAEKELDETAVAAEYENARAGVLAEIESLKADLERNKKRVELYQGGILLQAQQSLESALAGYQVGKVDFLTLINNWMMVENYELQYFFALADYHKALAGYELAVGGEITE